MKRGWKRMTAGVLLILLLAGCAGSKPKEDTLAVIKPQKDSSYTEMFRTLSLGSVFDYNLLLPHADTTWVEIWVEGYKKGEKMQDSQLIRLSYGNAPSESSEGAMGWGLVTKGGEQKSMILYAPGVSTGLIDVPGVIDKDRSSMMGSVIGDEKLELKAGESATLAVFRQSKSGGYRNYNANNPEELKEMLAADVLTLLLKIKVDTQSPKP
ncbi:hypothetical protein ACTHPF_19050 [Paenibacillus sp. SAF-054]|uniref:hypothetical protein n=1 Tax=unclassified Paenibacillus TaxID=185978 RepID=UPI003F810169